MGAWGTGPFDNDDACDWAIELADGEDDGPIVDALSAVVDAPADAYLEVDEGSCAVAAAAVVAALAGESVALPDELAEWVQIQPPDLAQALVSKHRDRAILALARVRGARSELHDLWRDSDDFAAWSAHLDRVLALLRRD